MLLGLLLLPLLLAQSLPASSSEWTHRHDTQITAASWRFLPEHDPKWLKAQYIQESWLNPDAVSHAGARGIAQFMPKTWQEVSKALKINASPHNSRAAIIAGAYYMQRMERVWRGRNRTANERLPLAWISYNFGVGNVLKRQEICDDGRLFMDLIPCLPKETREYPIRIRNHYKKL
jgi:soluble lytic murein transglycosylase-like protein